MDRDQRLREIRERVEKFDSADWGEKEESQAVLFSHAREDVPWLLAEVERLRKERDIARQMTGDCVHNIARDLEKAEAENRDLREHLEILECHDEDTRGRLRPDVLKDPPPPGCGVWVSKVQLVNRGAFDYPGSCVDG